MMSREEFNTDELNELRAAFKGEEYQKYQSKNEVTDLPDGFKQWVDDNTDASKELKSQPYFVRDNFVGGTLAGGLKLDLGLQKQAKTAAKTIDLIAEKIGIQKGNEMTFEEANELKGNMNFNKGGEYRVNCQSCVVANELRRRGYDVTAMPNMQKRGNLPYELSKRTEMAWIDPETGKYPEKLHAGGKLEIDSKLRIKSKSISSISKDINDFTSEVGRYNIDFVWKGKRSGHIITLERLESGNIRIYDPQNGKIVSWVDLSKQISTGYGVSVIRVDNLSLNTDIINEIVTKL